MRFFLRTGLAAALCIYSAAASSETLRIASPILSGPVGNPYQALSLPAIIPALAAFDPLVVIDSNGQVMPWLATSWASPDARIWTIELREGVVFSNGAPLNADAIVASVAHLQTPKGRTETTGSGLVNIDRAVAVSERKAEIHLKQPDALFPYRLAQWKIPEPQNWREQAAQGHEPRGLGTGPYVLVNDNPAKLTYRAHANAWNTPAVESLELLQLPDQVARVRAIAARSADIAMQIGAGDRPEIEMLGGEALTRRGMRVTYLSFATEHEIAKNSPIQNAKVRLAMNYAVDRSKIIGVILDGLGVPMAQLVLPGAPGYVAALQPYPYDPDRAKALLAVAGYPDGIDVTLRVAIVGADQGTVYQQLAQDMRAAGIRLTIRPAAVAEMTRMMFEGKFEAEMFSNIARGLDAVGDYRYRSCLGQTGSFKPYFCDPVTMDLIRQAQSAPDAVQLDRLLQQVTRREYENPPGVFLWQDSFIDGAGPRIDDAKDYETYYDYIPLHLIRLKK